MNEETKKMDNDTDFTISPLGARILAKTSFEDFKGHKLRVGDLVCYVNPEQTDKQGWNDNVEILRICRSIEDEQLFLRVVHPHKDLNGPFRMSYMDKKLRKVF